MPEPPKLTPQNCQKAFGKAVRALREDQDLSQESLGFRCALDRTYISGIERGVRNPTLKVLVQLANALGVSPAALLSESEKTT